MVNYTIKHLNSDDITLRPDDHFLYNKEDEKHICIQFEFLKYNRYGLPKKDKYHQTEDSRKYFQVPIKKDSKTYFKLRELDNKMRSLLTDGEYINNLKEPEKYPPSIKLKIKPNSKFWRNYKTGEEIQWTTIDDLKDKIKFNSNIRFVCKPKWYKYLNKTGISLDLRHLEAVEDKEEDSDIVMLDD